MLCPACADKPLEEAFSPSGILVDFCAACRGVWLDGGEIDFFVKDSRGLRLRLEEAFRAPAATSRLCPRDKGTLQEARLGEVLLDRCGSCQGLWTDEGEVHKLSKQLDRPVEPAAPPAAPAPVPAAAAVLSALPSLAFRSGAILVSLYGILAAVIFGAGAAGYLPLDVGAAVGIAIVLLQFALSPWFMDLSLRWFQGCRWTDASSLPAPAREFLVELCRKHGVPAPRVGIIEDGNPNAFTYGHTPRNARLVVTRGTLDLLDADELNGVLGHEMGHALHWDMLVMTVAALVPYLLYYAYRALWRAATRKKSGRGGKGQEVILAAAVVAYVAYIVTEYLLLFLSRTRELHADRFAGRETGKPNALASALVKIAYGLAGRQTAPAEGREGLRPVQSMGIFDPTSARALVASSLGTQTEVDNANILGAMQWDLWNPWAKYYELHSTHPLPAKRIELLGLQAASMGQQPYIHFDLRPPESYWDEFLVDLGAMWLPALVASAAWAALFASAGAAPAGDASLGAVLAGWGAGYLGQLFFSYPSGGFPERTVAALLKIVKVSQMRGVPARLQGTIIGRGIPGHLLSEDLVLRDATGFILLDYSQPMRLMEWWFALTRGRDYQGQAAVAEGYYRRGPVPYFELRRLSVGGERRSSWTLEARIVLGAALMLGGLYLLA